MTGLRTLALPGATALALALALAVLFPCHVARAGGFAIGQQGAEAAGTGSAGTARSGEAVCAWLNPAALTDGGGFRLGVGATLAFPSIHAEALDGSWSTRTERAISTPAYVYASFAMEKWALGLTFNVPYGSGIRWPEGWPGRFESLRSQPQFFRVAAFFAYRFGPFAIAAGPQVDIGRVETIRALDFVDQEGRVHLLLSGVGAGGHAGIFWRATQWLDLGFTYKSRTLVRLAGDADFTVPDSFVHRAPDQAAKATFTLPDRFALGLLGRFGPFRALLDLELTLWSVYDRLVVDFAYEGTEDSVVVNQWSPSVSVRGGSEYSPLPWLTLRLGLYFDQTPVPSRNLYPSSPDSHRVGVTLGAGARLGAHVYLDLFYDFAALLGQESTSDSAILARYSGQIHYVGLGLRVTAPARSGSPIPPTWDTAKSADK